jgi:tetratricopeptide (TPR) repeat protein
VAKRAASAIEASLQDEPDAELSRALAEVYLELERSAEALESAKRLREMSPSFCVNLAARFVEKGSPDRARQALALLPPLADLKPATLLAVGSIRQQLDEQKEAVEAYRMAVQKDPDYDEAVVGLADAYGQIGRFDKQYALMERRARSGGPEEWLDAADRHLWHDDYEGEADVLTEALDEFPRSPKLLARGVQSFGELAQYEKALKLYDRLQQMGRGGDAGTLAVVAEAMVKAGRLEEAERTYEQALQKDPLNRQALLGLGDLRAGKQHYRAAAGLYESYLKEKPEAGWVWFRLGEVTYEAGGDGKPAHERALALVPLTDEPATLAMHARVHARQKEWESAIGLYERALTVGRSDADLACDFVDVLFSAGRTERAERLLMATANRHPQSTRVWRQQAALMMRHARYAEAATILRKLHRRRPQDIGVESDLAFAERLSGRWSAAMQHYDSASARAGYRRRPMPASGLEPAMGSRL